VFQFALRPLMIYVSGDLDFGVCELGSTVSGLQLFQNLFVPDRYQEPKIRIYRSGDQINPGPESED